MSSKQWWAVVKGVKPGVYSGTWEEVLPYVGLFKDAKFKKYTTQKAAKNYFNNFVASKRFWAVIDSEGENSGIYEATDEEMKPIISSLDQSQYKSYVDLKEAQVWYNENTYNDSRSVSDNGSRSVSDDESNENMLSTSNGSDESHVVTKRDKPISKGVHSRSEKKQVYVSASNTGYGILITDRELCYYGEMEDEFPLIRTIKIALNILELENGFAIVTDDDTFVNLYKGKQKSTMHESVLKDLRKLLLSRKVQLVYRKDRYSDAVKVLSNLS
jgi:viroplasmin and RNaseH domain-containing protein